MRLDSPQIMAVLNVTPDSFSDGGALFEAGAPSLDKVLSRVEQVLLEGAAIIDVGGESTRPGAEVVGEQEELERVLPVLEALLARFDVPVSIDTSTPALMTAGARLGAALINDVRALERPGAIEAAATTGLSVCLMHMRGQPSTMQAQPAYTDVVAEVDAYFDQRIQACVQAGIDKDQLILDPGIGFGKSDEHNVALLKATSIFVNKGLPVLIGVSRKSLLGRLLGREPDRRLAGSLALAYDALLSGASILRVHDVAETADIRSIFDLLHRTQ